MRYTYRLLLFGLLIAQISCKTKKEKSLPDVSNIQITVKIDRLDKILQNVTSYEQVDSILRVNPMFAESFLQASAYPDLKILSKKYFQLLTDPSIDSLFIEVENEFGDMSNIENEFASAFQFLKYYYPDFKTPKIKTVVTGIANDLYLSDSLIIIGLDYYLGEDGKYVPDIPNYIAKRYQKEYMVPQCIMLYSIRYNANNNNDQTALADMIFYGKSYYFTSQVMPEVSDTLITGYSGNENQDIIEHENIIWAGLLENEALYETSHSIKEKFLGERPKTYEIGENCPGRIGRWVGYRIVSDYMEKHPDVTLQQLMADGDAQKIFVESAYRPMD